MGIDSTARRAVGLVLAGFVLTAIGCEGGKSVGSVAGTVKCNGVPVPAGAVNFLSKTGAAAQAKIDESGTYRLNEPLEAGDYQVYVSPPLPEPQAPGTRTSPAKKFVVPAKYQDATSSGVTVTVKAGSNDIAVDFKN